MRIELENILADVCTRSILKYQEAEELWLILGDKSKLCRAAEDANKFGFEATKKRATMGCYNECISAKRIKKLICIENKSPQKLTDSVNGLVGIVKVGGVVAREIKAIESVSVVESNGIYKAFVLTVTEAIGT